MKIDDGNLDGVLRSQEEANIIVRENQEFIINAVKNNITKSDIQALGYRKSQLEEFEKFLVQPGYFDLAKSNLGHQSGEAVWQNFFEKNHWIFGYGLSYIFNAPLDGERLEQVVGGATIFQKGKRVDALLKTKGIINSICFGEIKLHNTPLLKQTKGPYRAESWAISEELAGAVAQVQRSVQRSIESIKTKTEVKDEEDKPTGEQLFLYKPKAFLVIGSLSEFVADDRINEMKYSSFELFRKSIDTPEILTYDELYERASFIVKNAEN